MKRCLLLLVIPVTLLQLVGCATPVVLGAAAASSAAVANDERTTGTIIDDQGIEFKVAGRLNDDVGLKENGSISVTSYNGVVLLTGEVISPGLKQRASAIAHDTPQVRMVVNELELAEPDSVGDYAKDSWITTKVKSKLLGDDIVPGNKVKVVTDKRVVYLMGLISREQGRVAAELARQTDGVRKVVKLFEYQG